MNFDNIPQTLKQLNRWVCWQLEERDGKPTKVPKNPLTGKNALNNEAKTWGTFEQAVAGMQKYTLQGIGFVFNGDGLIGVDIDDCRDPDTGALTEMAKEVIQILDSYTEISPSGRGIHILCRGVLPGDKRQVFLGQDGVKRHFGMYEDGRFFIMTGDILDDAHKDIEDRIEPLAAVYRKYLAEEKAEKTADESAGSVYDRPVFVNGDEVMERMQRSSKWGVIKPLLDGYWEGNYPSHSEADLALMNYLAYFADKNEILMESLFRRSGLYRGPEEKKNPKYMKMTIAEAIRGTRSTYSEDAEARAERKAKKSAFPEGPPEMDLGLDYLGEPPPEQLPDWIFGPYNDMWNAQRLVELHGEDIRFNVTKECWYLWNGIHWEEDKRYGIRRLADEAILRLNRYKEQMYQKYALNSDRKKNAYTEFVDWLSKARNTGRKDNMIKEAQGMDGIAILSEDLDKNIWLLNCMNGTIDLRTGELKPHEKTDLISKVAPVVYDPKAEAPIFEAFLQKIFDGNAELIEFIQRAIGYSLTGSIEEQCVFICHGTGANGKSTLLNIIQEMLGEYAQSTNFATFAMRNDSNTNDIARLVGARFVSAMEVGEGRRLNEALIKQLSGGDKISARFLHKEFFDFVPTFKIWMGANHRPNIKETDHGTWRRIKLIPFDVTIPEEERDNNLPLKLKAELPGILAWAVRGCLLWQKEGLKPPEEVSKATDEYRSEMDVLQDFINECTVYKPGEMIKSSDLYRVYEIWCDENGEHCFSSTKFGTKLKERGIKKGRTMTMKVWEDIQLSETGKRLRYGVSSDNKKKKEYEQDTLPFD
ncbi:MAG: phage/plasmid primase, P4 family [Clostridiales bacterium]|jgi:putative DNA primase/helicase|nr:phage/plasmid primase, P4 family [Eubacteriales bacterium]MDH7566876.1 phage/plasmid primase, P4 family [Clostridiales bacterium]